MTRLEKKEIAEKRRYLQRVNKTHGDKLVMIPREEWPMTVVAISGSPNYVFRNNRFLVQVFAENLPIRISVNRTEIDNDGKWKADISWDDLQEIKNRVGYKDHDAVEVYPRERDVVNVANMRHLWVLPYPLPYAWREKDEALPS